LERLQAELWFWRSAAPAFRGSTSLWDVRTHLLRDRIHPFEIRLFKAHLAEVIAHRDSLLLQFDLQALQYDIECPPLAAKSQFADACNQHNLPHITTELMEPDRAEPKSLDLPMFIKPDRANRARGCAIVSQNSEGLLSLASREGETSGSWPSILGSHCPDEMLVMQPVMQNHPALEKLVGKILLTIRVVSGIQDKRAFCLSALAEIPLDETLPIARNWAIVPIEQETGQIAPFEYPSNLKTDCHPVTGAKLAGHVIPDWQSLVNLSLRAHELIAPEVPMVGWDLAITENGPVLIEANKGWAVATHCANSSGFDLAPARQFKRFADQLSAAY
jgi:hypothetical protein